MTLPLYIEENVPLNTYNWFQVGGNAKYFSYPENSIQFEHSIDFSITKQLSIKVIGLGANILVSDSGYPGLIIKLPNKKKEYMYISDEAGLLTADAGCTIEELIEYCLNDCYLFGLEEFSGIPSTVGGALFINLHYYQFLISEFVYSAKIYDTYTKTVMVVTKDWFEFGYDSSKVKNNKKYIIIEATFLLKRNTKEYAQYAKGRSIEIIRHRHNRYPYERTCGCFFKNLSADIVPPNHEGKKIIAAGYYLDKVGVRGELKINDCSVSSKHSNMIIHNRKGNATDIIGIAKIMQKKVYDQYGFLLEPECELIGFEPYPLYTLENIKDI